MEQRLYSVECMLSYTFDRIEVQAFLLVLDARKVCTDIVKKSWQRKWDEDNKGRSTYEFILVEVACGTISPLLTDETCDPVIGGHMT